MAKENNRSQQNLAQSLTLDTNNVLYLARQGLMKIPLREAVVMVFKPYFHEFRALGGHILEIVAKHDFRHDEGKIIARFSIPEIHQEDMGFIDTNIEADETLIMKSVEAVFGEVIGVILDYREYIIVFRLMAE
jgi:hypothetical protein